MNRRFTRLGTRTAAGALIAAGPIVAACSSGPSYEEWAATDGAAGRINMDDVQEAFKKSKSSTDFEKRVNAIYEGDGLVLIRARQDPDALVLEGWEDLNKNHEIDDAADDKLFDIVKRNEQHEMRGYGANSYYHHGFGAGNFLFTYMLISSISPLGYYYYTPPLYARNYLTSYRNSYRGMSVYRTQVSRNSRYFTSQKTGFASLPLQLGGPEPEHGQDELPVDPSSPPAHSRAARRACAAHGEPGAAEAPIRSSGVSRGGGFRGFGGAQRIIGVDRWAG